MHFHCIPLLTIFVTMSKSMTVNIKIPNHLKKAYNLELQDYSICLKQKNYGSAWHHLERSHIIGQSYPFHHTHVHWLMLKFGFREKNTKEIFGQILRLIFGGFKSFINYVPLGNTGGANVPPLKPMPLPDDIEKLLN